MSTGDTRAMFIIFTLLVALAARHPHVERKSAVYRLEHDVRAAMIFVNFSPEEERRIVEAASSMFTGRCTQAFIDAGLRSPYESLITSGVVFRPSIDLYNNRAQSLGLREESTRKAYAWAFSTGRAQGGTVSPMRGGTALTTDGKARVFLHNTAFYGESFWWGRVSLRDVLIHEFIHVGGQPQTFGWLGSLRHDLAGFAHYNQIMQACR